MKIRMKGNTIRYRLTKSEVEEFSNEGYYASETNFNGNKFIYALKSIYGISELSVDFQENTITIYLPVVDCKAWATSDRVGFSNDMLLENGDHLSLLLEKDFVCLDDRGEGESDNYPNPKKGNAL